MEKIEENQKYHPVSKTINIALLNAVKAFYHLVKPNVRLDSLKSRKLPSVEKLSLVLSKNEQYFVLLSKIRGELPAISILVIKAESVEIMSKAALVPGIDASENMREAMLKEIDNILTASVITELSNQLSVSAHGDVPSLSKLSPSDTQAYCEKRLKPYDWIFSEIVTFDSAFGPINFEFLWGFKASISSYTTKNLPQKDESLMDLSKDPEV